MKAIKIQCHLKNFLRAREMTQTELQTNTGLSEATVRRYCRSELKMIDCTTAITICDYFKVSLGRMFTIEEVIDEFRE